MTKEINIKDLVRGINARRGNVSIITPSSAPVSPMFGEGAFQSTAFQNSAFQTGVVV